MKIELPLDGKLAERVRATSDALFKSEYIFEILLAIATEDKVFASGMPKLVPGVQVNFASRWLKRLHGAGLVEAIESDEGQRREYYQRGESGLWPLLVAWLEDLEPPGDDANVAQLRR
jgi:DNA-binding transcriptional ArsR family regulator